MQYAAAGVLAGHVVHRIHEPVAHYVSRPGSGIGIPTIQLANMCLLVGFNVVAFLAFLFLLKRVRKDRLVPLCLVVLAACILIWLIPPFLPNGTQSASQNAFELALAQLRPAPTRSSAIFHWSLWTGIILEFVIIAAREMGHRSRALWRVAVGAHLWLIATIGLYAAMSINQPIACIQDPQSATAYCTRYVWDAPLFPWVEDMIAPLLKPSTA